MITAPDGGIGVTFFSQYPNMDAYYRLKREYDSGEFHIAPHGTNVTGDIVTGVVPSPNIWYWFRILVEDTGSRTEIRAKGMAISQAVLQEALAVTRRPNSRSRPSSLPLRPTNRQGFSSLPR